MRTGNRLTTLSVISACWLAVATPSVPAAQLTDTFANLAETNLIYMWSDDISVMQFTGASFGVVMNDWSMPFNDGELLIASGSTVAAAAGAYDLTFEHTGTPFSFEWAELLFDGVDYNLAVFGTRTWDGADWLETKAFTHTGDLPASIHTPIPAPVVLILSGILFLPWRRAGRLATEY